MPCRHGAGLLAAALAMALLAATQGAPGASVEDVTGDHGTFIVPLDGAVVALERPIRPLVTAIAPLTGDQNALIAEEGAGSVSFDLAADVFFDFDSADLRDDARAFLDAVSDRIADDAPTAVAIAGHTDSVGDPAYNQGLSDQRAASVRTFLVEEAGLADIDITVEGFGATRPIAPNEAEDADGNLVDNPDGRQRNRRVEITYTDPDSAG